MKSPLEHVCWKDTLIFFENENDKENGSGRGEVDSPSVERFRARSVAMLSFWNPSFRFPLFCLFGGANKSLAGDEKYDSQDSQLSSLRKDFAQKPLERKEYHKPENCQMSSVWQSEGVERRDATDASRQGAALLVPRLLLSVFRAVAVLLAEPLFSFFNYRLFLEVSSMEALL